MKEFTFDTSDMSNITLYTAANTTLDTSMRNKGLKSNLFCMYTHINRMKPLPQYVHTDKVLYCSVFFII